MKTKLLLFVLILLGLPVSVNGQSAANEHSNEYTTGMQHYDNKNFGMAFNQFQQGAENGYADAQNALGDCYYEGEGVTKDLQKAVYWYQKAAEQGYAPAQYSLGYCYQEGEGVTKDIVQAIKWYDKASEAGDADAQNALGDCYYEGIGVPQNYKEAFYLFNKAANKDNVEAMYSLGYCYLNGEGTETDTQRGIYWLKKAADEGHDLAQYNMGLCYYEGNGVAQNMQEAKNWFKKAAEQDNEDAQKILAELKDQNTSVKNQSEQKAIPQTAQSAQTAKAVVEEDDDDDAPKPTAAELAALKKFKASMAGHTYQCSNFKFNDPTLDYIMSAGGMQIVASIVFVSKTQAKVKATFKLNSSAAQRSPTAYQMKESIERIMNYTGTIYTWGPYLAFKNPNGNSDYMVKPREGTLKLVDEYGNVFKKVK